MILLGIFLNKAIFLRFLMDLYNNLLFVYGEPMKNIKYLILDVDGTLTDGKIYIGNEGEPFKAFNCKDGYGIKRMAIPAGIIPIVMTGRSSKIVENRCLELGIDTIYQGIIDKAPKLLELFPDEELSKLAYIGDDLNDLPCMELIKNAGGLIGCPMDSAKEVVELSDYVCQAKGGEGAVREFIQWLLD